jgi:uncharacterized membrane protein
MALAIPERFRKLLINVGLLFVGAALSTGLALAQTTPKTDLKVFVIAVVSGAAIAGVRAVVGFIALQASGIPAVPVDV